MRSSPLRIMKRSPYLPPAEPLREGAPLRCGCVIGSYSPSVSQPGLPSALFCYFSSRTSLFLKRLVCFLCTVLSLFFGADILDAPCPQNMEAYSLALTPIC